MEAETGENQFELLRWWFIKNKRNRVNIHKVRSLLVNCLWPAETRSQMAIRKQRAYNFPIVFWGILMLCALRQHFANKIQNRFLLCTPNRSWQELSLSRAPRQPTCQAQIKRSVQFQVKHISRNLKLHPSTTKNISDEFTHFRHYPGFLNG